jgi:hypothetical protein
LVELKGSSMEIIVSYKEKRRAKQTIKTEERKDND